MNPMESSGAAVRIIAEARPSDEAAWIFSRILWRSRTVAALSFSRPVRLPPERSCRRTVAANRSTSACWQRSAIRSMACSMVGAIGDLVGGHAELRADRIGHLAAHQVDGGRHRVAGLERLRTMISSACGSWKPSALARFFSHELQIEDRAADPEQPATPTGNSIGFLESTAAAMPPTRPAATA